MAQSADGGTEASKRMHEYLLSKQRKQEEYWLRKYGKVLQAPAKSGTSSTNPRVPSMGGSNPTSGRTSNAGALSTESSTAGRGLLPPIPGASQQGAQPPSGPVGALPHHHRQPKGQAPIFHAKEPVRDFFSRNVRQPRASAAAPVRDEFGNLPPVSHMPPEPYRKDRPGQQLPPLGGDRSYAAGAQVSQGEYSAPQLGGEGYEGWQEQPPIQPTEGASPRIGTYLTNQHSSYKLAGSPTGPHMQRSPQHGHVASGALHPRLPPLSHDAHAGMRASQHASHHASQHASSNYQNKPLRNLELELTVIKAIKAREDVLERLRIAGSKLDNSFGGTVPVVLSSVDPMVRLFYRLVSSLRQRTLDAVESIAAWRRKVSPTEPFIYFGVDYLAGIGPDASFLDALPFLRSRLSFGRAADDPFLAELTPDGVPIEEATTCDLRRGGQRFSSDALRIRMARKVLALYCGRTLPHDTSSYTLEGGASTASGLAGGLPPIASPIKAEPSSASAGGFEEQPQDRLASPPVAKVPAAALPPLPRAITPPAMSSSAGASPVAAQAVDETVTADDLESLEPETSMEPEPMPEMQPEATAELEAAAQWAEEEQGGAEQEGEDDRARIDQGAERLDEPAAAAGAEMAEAQAPQARALTADDLLVFEDDGDYIDFALGAIIHSLEPQYVDTIMPGAFTVAGWEIDRQLEEVVRGISSPERASRSRTTSPPKPVAAAGPMPPSRNGPSVSAPDPPPKPPSRGGRIPGPPADPAPLSRGASASRGRSRIPAPPSSTERPPVRVHLRPGSRGVGMNISMDGEDFGVPDTATSQVAGVSGADDPASQDRPPVRVHLRPGSRGLGMNISMDGEELGMAPAPAGLSAISEDRSAYFTEGDAAEDGKGSRSGMSRPPVRVHLRPNSRSLELGLSMDGEALELHDYAPSAQAAAGDDADMDVPTFSGARGPVEDKTPMIDGGGGASSSPNNLGGLAAASRPPVRVHLRPGSQGVAMGLSVDGESFDMMGPGAASGGEGMPAVVESEMETETPRMQPVAVLEDSPSPLQGSLSGRANRASIRSARSRPGSAVASSREGLTRGADAIGAEL
ncbi:hypothetical protein GPECTOR_6g562 [Gonium pectorale]|uniref:Uncharacterized protein n=1 Tax=Gonium pectorale TaxID=33097 RepID=A0A150GUV6_GONPE|nr:hypothetical protein GPECTOR_6g562 [Gonium pectorale]|eukprot:KXZ53645.1 hypothetical protein GPECTOR_6g562 [Gonium pectorale]